LFIVALNRLTEFQRCMQSEKFYRLRTSSSLQFLFRFAGELEYEWKQNRNFQYPFEDDNVDYCLDEHPQYPFYYWQCRSTEKIFYSLLIFTRSLQITYREVHNHSFSTLKSRSITWTCDHIDSSEQILNSLRKFKTTKQLTINSQWMGTKFQSVSITIAESLPLKVF
jgi:hypothetical protein